MALSLKSNLVEYYQKVGTITGPPTSLDSKGDYGPKFNAIAQYTKKVNIGSEESSPLFNKYPIGFIPDNTLARQPEKFNPNLISISAPENRFYYKTRGEEKSFRIPKQWKHKNIAPAGPHRIKYLDVDKSSIYNFYSKEQSLSPLTSLYNQSQYYGDSLNFRSEGVTTNRFSLGLATDQPFILRGIQRVDNKKKEPQRYGDFLGLGDSPLELMLQGSFLTNVERNAVDLVRRGKFRLSPKGLVFTAKQFGFGIPSGKGYGIWSTLTTGSSRYSTMDYFQLGGGIGIKKLVGAVKKALFGNEGYQFEGYSDFRHKAFEKGIGKSDSPTPFIGSPDVSDYIFNNPISKFGMGDPGKTSGVDRSNYKKPQGLGDRINALLINGAPEDQSPTIRDYVKFRFKDIDGSSNLMVFRATFGALNDSFSPNWTSKQYMGRSDSVHVYESYGRTITFDFTVYADTRENMRPMWQKLNMLASYTTPSFDDSGRAESPIMRLTLGDYLVDQPGFLSTFSLGTDANHPWEINIEDDEDMFQLPKIMKVNCTYTIINQKLPQRTAWFFGNEIGELEDGEQTGLSLGRKWLTPVKPVTEGS